MKLCPLNIKCCGQSLWVMVDETNKQEEEFQVIRVREALMTAIEDKLVYQDKIVAEAQG